MTRRGVIGLFAAAASAALAGCSLDPDKIAFFYPAYRYRLTVEVETPEGVKRGHSVIEVKWSISSFVVKGEAAAVDLPGGQTLFVLLRSESNPDWSAYAHELVKLPPDDDAPKGAARTVADEESAYRRIAADRVIYTVPRTKTINTEKRSNYPYFVRFRDVRDPTSVEEVDPDNLAKSFGPSFTLKALTIQMTDESVTNEVEKRLKWLPNPKTRFVEPYRDPNTGYAAPNPDRKSDSIPDLSALDFSTEPF